MNWGATPPMGVPLTETDEQFRRRIAYCVVDGGGPKLTARVLQGRGVELDDVADEYGLRRLSAADARRYHGE